MIMPFVIQQTTQFMPLFCYSLLCLSIAIALEQIITLKIIKTLDSMQWINQDIKAITIFINIVIAVCIICFLVTSFTDISPTNCMAICVVMPLITRNLKVYVGKQYICIPYNYINISDITAYKQDVEKHYTQFILYTEKTSYAVRLNPNNTTGINILTTTLATIPYISE